MEKSTQELVISPQEAYLLSILQSLWKNRCISVIIGLRIPELLCNSEKSPMSIDEIAANSGCQQSTKLYPVMKSLAQWGIGKELPNKHFTANEVMEVLRRDKGPSVGHYFDYICSEEHFSALRCLGATVKQPDKSAFVLEHGMDHFAYMNDLNRSYEQRIFKGSSKNMIGSDDRRKEFAENYSSAIAYISCLHTFPNKPFVKNVYKVFPWSTCNKLLDIGGSLGSFLASILKLPGCQHVEGYIMELPDVVDQAKAKYQDLEIPEQRIKFIKHDCTEPFSSDLDLQVDTIMFKNTISVFLHDHVMLSKILTNCRTLFPSEGGRLLIIDFLAPEEKDEVGINGIQLGAHSIHWLSICKTNGLVTKREWVKQLQLVGNELGFKLDNFYETFTCGQVIFELSYKQK